MARLARARPHRPILGKAVLTAAGGALVAGVASFTSSGPASIVVTAADATGGTAPYTYQWQRNASGGSYANISNGGGVTGATTRTLTDGSAVAGTLYGYKLVFTDNVSVTVTSNAVTAQIYTGGALTGGGGGGLVGPGALVTC